MQQESLKGASGHDYKSLGEKFRKPLVAWLDRTFRGAVDSEVVAEQALIRAARGESDLGRGKAQLTTWLYRIARNLALDELRGPEARLASRCQPIDGPQVRSNPPSGGDPAEVRERQLERDRLWRAVRALPSQLRFPVILVCMRGRSEKETGRRLSKTPRQVAYAVTRGLERLRFSLKQETPNLSAMEEDDDAQGCTQRRTNGRGLPESPERVRKSGSGRETA